jgi:sporulation protein YunB
MKRLFIGDYERVSPYPTSKTTPPQRFAYNPKKPRKGLSRKFKRRVILFVCILIAIAVAFGGYFQTNVTRVLLSISEATMRASTTIAVNDAVYYTLGDEMRYDDLVSITRNEQGEIIAVSANALKINRIARDTASISQANLKNLSLNGIPVPLGALSGIEALAGVGPSVNFKIIPVSSVTCDFSSEFKSVGINQIKHSIYLNVIADISIVMPSRTQHFDVATDILVGEFIVVGSIPDTYLQTDIFDNPLQLNK